MKAATITLIGVMLQTDPTVSESEREQIMKSLAIPANSSRILKRKEVAARLGVCLRVVDSLKIKRVRLPGRKNAAGFLETDIAALL